jgi:hypothetical protein
VRDHEANFIWKRGRHTCSLEKKMNSTKVTNIVGLSYLREIELELFFESICYFKKKPSTRSNYLREMICCKFAYNRWIGCNCRRNNSAKKCIKNWRLCQNNEECSKNSRFGSGEMFLSQLCLLRMWKRSWNLLRYTMIK